MPFSFNGSVAGLITLGNDATRQNLFTISNKIGSRVNVYIRRLTAQLDALNVITSVQPIVRTSRASNISGGVILSDSNFDTNNTSSPFVEVRTAYMDGFPLTATEGTTLWQQYPGRMHTIVEQVQSIDTNALPILVENKDFILRPGESILVQAVSPNITTNTRIVNNWWVACQWEEELVSTFNISGTVTLGGSPVSGAIVTIIEADDINMTNQLIVEKIVTGAGGTWASTIRTGKIGAAFVQYESGGTYYTAPGSPYLA